MFETNYMRTLRQRRAAKLAHGAMQGAWWASAAFVFLALGLSLCEAGTPARTAAPAAYAGATLTWVAGLVAAFVSTRYASLSRR